MTMRVTRLSSAPTYEAAAHHGDNVSAAPATLLVIMSTASRA